MLDLKRLNKMRLSPVPKVHLLMAKTLLTPNYKLAPVNIVMEGVENIPAHPVIFALNHTDRYNYWPFQFELWKKTGRFTASWIKGKYFENYFIGKFMESVNSIPAISRGYILTKDFLQTVKRKPTNEEYNTLRSWIDAYFWNQEIKEEGAEKIPPILLTKKRNILGRDFQPKNETYAEAICKLFEIMNQRFLELNQEAIDKNLDTLIFPQGTRSIRLSRGRSGISQAALYFKRDIVPVGCSGSDIVYPANSPVAKPGTITFRIGKSITYEDMKPFYPETPFTPFTGKAEKNHKEKFQSLADHVMEKINDLVDEPYKFSESKISDGPSGAKRFV